MNTSNKSAVWLACGFSVALCAAYSSLYAQTAQPASRAADVRQAPAADKNIEAREEVPLASAQEIDAGLRDDLRLQRKISVDVVGVSLKEFLHSQSSDKLILKAQEQYGEQKLQVHLKQRSLYVLLQSLAQLLDGYWQKRTDNQGYTFSQRLRATRRRDAWWHLYTTEREQALAKITADTVADMNRPVKARDPNSPEYQKEPGDPEVEAQTARSHNTFGQLPGTLQQRIAASFDPIFTCDMEGFQGFSPQEGGAVIRLRDLPPDAQKVVAQHASSTLLNTNPLIQFSNSGYSIGSLIVRPGQQWAWAGLQLGGIRRPSRFALAVCWVNHALLAQLIPPAPASSTIDPNARGAHPPHSAPPQGWQQLADYQRSRVWPNDVGKIQDGKIRMFPAPLRSERLQWLARQAGMEYVSDYYTDAGQRMEEERDQPLTRPLKEELDALALEQDVSWKRGEDMVYLFRNNRWYRDDQLEIPGAYARALLLRCVDLFTVNPLTRDTGDEPQAGNHTPGPSPQQVATQLQLDSEVVSALSPWQIANGLQRYRLADGIVPVRSFFDKYQQPKGGFPPMRGATLENHPGPNDSRQPQSKPPAKRSKSQSTPELRHVWQPFTKLAHTLLEHRRLLLFYAGLGTEQRNALLQGRLAWSALTPQQQEQAADFAPLVMAEGAKAAPAEPLLGIHVGIGGGIGGDNEAYTFPILNILELYVANPNTTQAQPQP